MPTTLNRRHFGLGAASVAGTLPLAAEAARSLKYANTANPNTLANRFWAKVVDEVARRTDGAVTIEMFAGTLGDEKTLLEGLALGTIDIYNGAYTGTREFDILFSPNLFRDGAHAGAVMQGPLGAAASRTLTELYQARLIGIGRLGPLALFLKEPIESLDDLAGRRIRVPQIEGCVVAVEHLGGTPAPIPFDEVQLALQSGAVDGFVTALNIAVALRFDRVVTYLVANDFGQALDKSLVALRSWDRLEPAHARALVDVFETFEPSDYFEVGLRTAAAAKETWRQRNGEESVLTLDQAKLATAMAPLNERLVKDVYGEAGWDMIQAALG